MEDKEKNPYRITIVGEQRVDGDNNKIEVITDGKFMVKNNHFYIGYREYDEDSPHRFFNNLIKVENNMVTISRKGPQRSRLMLEKGRRHQCIYGTPAGNHNRGDSTNADKSRHGERASTLEGN